MEIDVVVTVEVEGEPQSRLSEQRFEDEVLQAVKAAVLKESSINVAAVSLIDFEHCKWVRELGMPVAWKEIPEGVDVFEDGSWSVPANGFGKESMASGPDLSSLLEYIQTRKDR